MPAEAWERVEPLFKSGQAKMEQADLHSAKFTINPDKYYLNCTGPDLLQNRFISSLSQKGILQLHPAGGIRSSENMHIISKAGKASNVYSTIGPVRKGEDFETVAMIEIVEQTSALVSSLAKGMRQGKPTQVMSKL